ncbi:hypothetical protein C0J52_02537 [Blattella germanica]|nr:hypothetical protein C0J52_02537 [Blattella germanica]
MLRPWESIDTEPHSSSSTTTTTTTITTTTTPTAAANISTHNNNNNNNNNSDNVTVGTSGYIGTLNKQSQQIRLNVFQYFTKTRQGKGAIIS